MAREEGAAEPERRLADNPFYVLGLRPTCSRLDVEREGQKLLGMLELGLKAAKTYMTPLGPQARTADKVRGAMAELRSPDRRLVHEFWAALPPAPEPPKPPPAVPQAPGDMPPLTEAFALLGWRRP
ncbi:MAG: hypothetical protein JNL82_10770 [Myxococcales bacterium]|nr:hypothetical protein [Myxococcales bacterium]